MPELSRFAGIIIKMIFNDTVQHNKPHVHVYYGDYQASVGIDGELLAGSLPVKQLKMVVGWLALHEEEAYAAWNKAVRGESFDKIIMYIVNGIAHAGTKMENILVQAVKPLDDMMMIITFISGEKRLYDATQLLAFPAFQPLVNEEVFKNAKVEYGVVTWADGEIDIAPETMYENSYAYEELMVQ